MGVILLPLPQSRSPGDPREHGHTTMELFGGMLVYCLPFAEYLNFGAIKACSEAQITGFEAFACGSAQFFLD